MSSSGMGEKGRTAGAQSFGQKSSGGRRRGPRWLEEILDEELARELKAQFGSIKRGIRELLEAYKRAHGPRDPVLFRVWEELVKLQDQEPDKCLPLHKVFDTIRSLGYDTKVFYRLLEEGYIKHCGPGKVAIVNSKDLTTLFLPF